MRVLVLNCGGSSLKYRLYDLPGAPRREDSTVIAGGEVQRLGQKVSHLSHKTARGEYQADCPDLDHQKAIDLALSLLVDPERGAVSSLDEIDAVGHRVVHAGTRYTGSVLVTPDVVDALTECIELAPLHNPPNIAGIRACQALMPGIPQVAVFDNALHSNVPMHSYIYGLPYEYYQRYGIRRYGFHGITFSYMREAAASFLGRPLYDLKLVLLMLGSGWTACAMDCGRSIDISTGFTPTEGLTQSTRCGDVDPLAITYLMKKEDLSPEQMEDILNRRSGWLGVSGVSADLREVEEAAQAGNQRAQLALDMLAYRARKYVGAYAAAMGGLDAVVFSGGIGERSSAMRWTITSGLEFLGLDVDYDVNRAAKPRTDDSPIDISSPDARVRCLVVPTDEEWSIARETYAIAAPLAGGGA